MPLLIVPLVILVLLVLWLLLLPLSLWQRYRMGKARRRAWPWMVKLNCWMLLLSACVFAGQHGLDQCVVARCAGLCAVQGWASAW